MLGGGASPKTTLPLDLWLWCGLMNEWQHKDKFSFPEDIMDGTMLILDGMEYRWQDLAGLPSWLGIE